MCPIFFVVRHVCHRHQCSLSWIEKLNFRSKFEPGVVVLAHRPKCCVAAASIKSQQQPVNVGQNNLAFSTIQKPFGCAQDTHSGICDSEDKKGPKENLHVLEGK